jgi:hypothetical protein
MSLDLAKFDAALKVHYGPQRMAVIGYEGRPFYTMLSKYTKFGGRNMPYPVRYAGPQNLGADFGAANRINSGDPATSSSELAEFLVTRKRKYGMVVLDRETMIASEKDADAFARATTMEIDAGLDGFNDEVHQGLFKSGTGARAALTAVAGTTWTVALSDITRFEKGMAIQVSDTTTATSILETDIVTILSVNRDAGTLLLSAAVAGAGVGQHVFRYGDRQQAAITADSQWLNSPGLPDIIPAVAPTGGDLFRGVDRSQDPTRLAGHRISWAGDYKKTFMKCGVEMGRHGAKGDKVLFVNHTDLSGIMDEYSDKLEHRSNVAVSEFSAGFEAYSVKTPMGKVTIVPDHQCPAGAGWLLTIADWELVSARAVPHFIDEGGKFLRSHESDSFKVEFVAYYALACKNPGRSAYVAFS